MFQLTTINKIEVKPELLLIPEFSEVWDNDKSKDKAQAMSYFKYIYFIADFKSPYKNSSISEEQLYKRVKEDFMPSSWKEPKYITNAIRKYKELQYTKTLRLFDAANMALEQIVKYFEEFNIDNLTGDKKDDAVSKVMRNLKEVSEVAAKLELAKKKVEKELSMKEKEIRGKGTLRSRELPKSKRK